MTRKNLKLVALTGLLIACSAPKKEPQSTDILDKSLPELTQYVNPFVGTENMGHTYPGATVPFGAVQLSPETKIPEMFIDGKYNPETYKYCSGYQYSDSTIYGFSHTHFSGTGHADLGDILILPITKETETTGRPYSHFSHEKEAASPGYYSVFLSDYNVNCELTTSTRVGMHQYTFEAADSAEILLDLTANIYNYEGKNVWSFLRVENDTLITGYRQTSGWARTKTVYFAMAFSSPIDTYQLENIAPGPYNGFYRKFDENNNFPEMAGKEIKGHFNFDLTENKTVQVKVALSSVSTAGALANMQAEIPHWNFERVHDEAKENWNKELAKLQVETITPDDKKTFYTALYHSFLGPTIYEDVNGNYRGLDQNIHQSEDFENYTTFSLWDTYRALHPLFNIIQPERNENMIKSMLAHHDQSVHKTLPVWSHYNNENWCMIGYHSVSVIADAIAKGNDNFNVSAALEAAVNSSNCSYYDGIEAYLEYGYVPEDINGNSASKTLEYAYDDWAISQIAAYLENAEITETYLKRAESYRHLFDDSIGFIRPKNSDGNWKAPFDPLETHGQGFIEGNAWNYGLYVPHNPNYLVEVHGGKAAFSAHLDSLFTMELDAKYYAKNEDITRDGIIGNYVHGNEPGHHIPYLYNWTNTPWKTEAQVRQIMTEMYGNTTTGLCGNDDAGQMSAWYIFSAIGFYPVCPGSDEYALGSPLIKSARIQLKNREILEIKTINQSEENVYVEKIELNGKVLEGYTIKHEDIRYGGELIFYMSPTPVNRRTN